MRDYTELIKQTRESLSEVADCMGCCVGWSIRENKCLLDHCADAIEELLITTSAQKETIEELRARNSAQADMLDGEWASVEERLPEKHQAVLFYIPWNKTNMIGWIDEGDGINLEGYGKCYDFSLIKPSHWMPLEKNAHAWIQYPNKLVIHLGGNLRECEIKFCPMCGRRLEVE